MVVVTNYAMKSGKSVDYEEAIKYPLSVIPASLSHGDGTKKMNINQSHRSSARDG